jgi:choline dehydrogenase-like flavoprotein
MVAKFELNDDSVVVVIGTGAGGGVVANELAQKGVKVVALEAGGRYLPDDYINDEWESFGQLAWLDARSTSGDWRVAKDFSGLPAWIVKAVGGTTTHWAGASLRFQAHEFKTKPQTMAMFPAPICWTGRSTWRKWNPGTKRRKTKHGRHPHQRHSRSSRQQQLQGV